jgi:hypothetical protein
MSFPKIKRHPWKKRKTITMYLFRRRGWGASTPATTPEVELQAENGAFLFTEDAKYLIKE